MLFIELVIKIYFVKFFGSIIEEVYKYLFEVKKDFFLNVLFF